MERLFPRRSDWIFDSEYEVFARWWIGRQKDKNSVLGMHPNITVRFTFFFVLSSSGCGSSRPSRGDGTTLTRAFGFVVVTGATTSDDTNDTAIDAAASMTRRGEDNAEFVFAFLPRPLLRDAVLLFLALGDDGAAAVDEGDGALLVDVGAEAVVGDDEPSGMEGDIADKMPLHWL